MRLHVASTGREREAAHDRQGEFRLRALPVKARACPGTIGIGPVPLLVVTLPHVTDMVSPGKLLRAETALCPPQNRQRVRVHARISRASAMIPVPGNRSARASRAGS